MFTHEPERLTQTTRGRWRFWLLLVGVPLLLLGGVVTVWIVAVSMRLHRVIADIDAYDPNWRLEDLEDARAVPPPGQNAADGVIAVIRLLPRGWWTGQPPSNPPKNSSEVFHRLHNLHPPALLNEQQVVAVQAILQAAGLPALTEARSLIETPRGRHTIAFSPDYVSTLLGKVQEHRQVAALLRLDALERAQAGDLAAAVAACHAVFHTGCAVGDEPFMASQGVRIACQAVAVNALERVLAQGEPPTDRLATLQARLEMEEPMPVFLDAVRGLRAGGNYLFENLRNGSTSTAGLVAIYRKSLSDQEILLLNVPGYVTTQHAAYLRYMNEVSEVARRPPSEWAAFFEALRAKAPNPPLVVRLLAPEMHKMAEYCQRNHATLRNAIVALAAERFRQQHGRWPESCDELVAAKLLAAVPTDPYDGQPIRFVRTADGLVVYCIGPDGTDDGGTLDRQNQHNAGIDLGFQLWDVPARRSPAPPPKPPESGDGG